MRCWARRMALIALLAWTLIVHTYHMGVLPPPRVPEGDSGKGRFISRQEEGLNHLILEGSPYSRGLKSGELTQDLLLRQEDSLMHDLRAIIPSPALLRAAIFGLIFYFYGADHEISKDDLLEMYGTSRFAPTKYDYLADRYTRQLAYHGLHEVGQMMVDRGFEDTGCTVLAVPHKNGWILGRNFDFESGPIFDREKLVKWVFPERGFAHLSVIWAGMVGAVTGVNEHGLYVSLNAAGSSGYRRVGTPTTLVVYKILREARTVDEAIAILQSARVFITDIFVVTDSNGRLVRIERSPQKMNVIDERGPTAIANHLIGPHFALDETNAFRKRELTTLTRAERGQNLVKRIDPRISADAKIGKILEGLRDKGVDQMGRPLHLANRKAIDALIATHSVIYDSSRMQFYISHGPSVSGPFSGYDLKASFASRTPVRIGRLPADPLVPDPVYNEMRASAEHIKRALVLVEEHECAEAAEELRSAPEVGRSSGRYWAALGDVQECQKQSSEARSSWQKALQMEPAYARWERSLRAKLQKADTE